MADGTGPAAGWYADPRGGERRRYWDGSAWTEHLEPEPEPTPPPAAVPPPAAEPVAPASPPPPAPSAPAIDMGATATPAVVSTTMSSGPAPSWVVGATLLLIWALGGLYRIYKARQPFELNPYFNDRFVGTGLDNRVEEVFSSAYGSVFLAGSDVESPVSDGLLFEDLLHLHQLFDESGGFWGFVSIPALMLAATAVFAVMALVSGNPGSRSIAALLAGANVALALVSNVPLFVDRDFITWGSFVGGAIMTSVLVLPGALLLLRGGGSASGSPGGGF
ncbi:MAG: DUF2510 domain-containing protein [Actinomycetota bacterium]